VGTSEGFLPGVGSDMIFQLASARERFRAVRTDKILTRHNHLQMES